MLFTATTLMVPPVPSNTSGFKSVAVDKDGSLFM
jgi:hypothetical protein